MNPPRVRFAPSPTGFLHVGGVRTALYNWLFARRTGGTFILRIEDTDEERNREEWVNGILESLRWVGLDWDEGPYRQSERSELYAGAAGKLEADGRAYWCDCTRGAIDARAKERGGPPGYDGWCRGRGLAAGAGRALRFRTPDEGAIVVSDMVRGEPVFESSTIEDFVIVRSSGRPIFVLANVVDDSEMAVSHVIRAEEHLPSTPKYVMLWEALGAGPRPVFAHLPLLVNERRQKLSKRRDPVAIEQYRTEGYLPEVMLNYLALLGWGPARGRERLSIDEMIDEFRLEDVNPSPAFFDVAKLRAFNGDSIRELPVDEFVDQSLPWLTGPGAPWPSGAFDRAVFEALAPVVQERVFRLDEVPGMIDFVFLEAPVVDQRSWDKAMVPPAASVLEGAAAAFASCPWVASELKAVLTTVGEELGLSLKKTQASVRVAVTGRSIGPPLFEAMQVMDRSEVLDRLESARTKL